MIYLSTDHDGNPLYTIDKGDSIPFYFYVERGTSAADLTSKKSYFTLRQYRDSTPVIDAAECTNVETTGYTGYTLTSTVSLTLSYGYYEFEVKTIYATNAEVVYKKGKVYVR
jgi:hypothetical protein